MADRDGILAEGLAELLRPLVRQLAQEAVDQRLAELAAPDWLTLPEAAVVYRTSADTLRKRAQRGRLPGAVRDEGRWLLDRRVLDATLAGKIPVSDKRGERRSSGPAPGTRRY